MSGSFVDGLAALRPGDPGSNPGWSAAQIQIDIEFTRIMSNAHCNHSDCEEPCRYQ